MNPTLILAVCVISVICQEKYPSKYDNVDVDTIIKNDRLLKNYVGCLLDKAKYTGDAEELKKHIPEALETTCAKCTEEQETGIRKVVKYLTTEKKDYWDQLLEKYDSKGTYRKKYEESIKSEGIQV